MNKKELETVREMMKDFDDYQISKNWRMVVKPVFGQPNKYEIYFWLNGVKYGYKQYFIDPTLAVSTGKMFLDNAYKNKGFYPTNYPTVNKVSENVIKPDFTPKTAVNE